MGGSQPYNLDGSKTMSDKKLDDIPFSSPILPNRLELDSKICFECKPGISCFNACCKQADITLAPYDIIRLKNRLGLSSTEFLKKHTVPFEMDAHGMPGIKMRTTDVDPVCLFNNLSNHSQPDRLTVITNNIIPMVILLIFNISFVPTQYLIPYT